MTVKIEKRVKALEFAPEKLRWRCDSSIFDNFDESEFDINHLIIGQDRALKALRLGLDISSPGYNVFISGYPGTGRKTAVKTLMNRKKISDQTPDDLCYIHNFENGNNPKTIALPPGEGRRFKNDMDNFVSFLKKQILPVFSTAYYNEKRRQLIANHEIEKQVILDPFEQKIKRNGLSLEIHQVTNYSQIELVPADGGKLISQEISGPAVETEVLISDSQCLINTGHKQLDKEFRNIRDRVRANEEDLAEKLGLLDRNIVIPKLEKKISEIRNKYSSEDIQSFLTEVQKNVIERIEDFKDDSGNSTNGSFFSIHLPDQFWEFRVNLLVDNSRAKAVPVVWEESPALEKLFGTIERVSDFKGDYRTDFTKIHAGSLLKANGGFLIISLSSDYDVTALWYRLKQCLKTGKLTFDVNDSSKTVAPLALKPEPIGIKVKIVVIGDDNHYYLLSDYDNEFNKLFKVRADFDTITPKNNFVILQFAAFIKNLCKTESLLSFSNDGLTAIIEHGVRMAENQDKITTEIAIIADIVREANYWAETDESEDITEEHVETAINERISRVDLIEQRIYEKYVEGTTLLDITGTKIGQLNGLTVTDLGDHSFGRPVRLTAKSSMGRSGIVNIERESDFSGRSHTKGISILSGYFKDLYAQDKTINMTASICFEQSYNKIDGDSASAAEVFVLLSSLGRIPLRQDIAITASMSQNGEIQPIGGVNEKIEGFYQVCKKLGLTGTQGVIIPLLNARDLQLRKEVVEAVRNGNFHIYAIETIDEGLEILTGIEANSKTRNGAFKKDTIHYLVDQRLIELNKRDKEQDND